MLIDIHLSPYISWLHVCAGMGRLNPGYDVEIAAITSTSMLILAARDVNLFSLGSNGMF